jgi:hypothetical protein
LERERKVNMHCYNKHQHLLFKYHYKASTRRDGLNQRKTRTSGENQGCSVEAQATSISQGT